MNPLDQLRDIHLPSAVQWWPPAIGWWLLAALLLGVLVAVWVNYKKNKKQRKLVNHAMESLQELGRDTELDSQQWVQALSALLRRIVINLHGRQAVAGLVGQQWLEYLDKHSKNADFTRGVGRLLVTEPYQAATSYDRHALFELVSRWVKSQSKFVQRKPGVDHA